MMNQVMLVGRNIGIESFENKKVKKAIVTIACPRNFKNEEGIYETDFIDCTIYNNLADKIIEYCKKGDLIGIRGCLRQGVKNKRLEFVADKVSFLSTKTNKESESENN